MMGLGKPVTPFKHCNFWYQLVRFLGCTTFGPAPKVLAQQVPLAEKLAKASASVSIRIFVVNTYGFGMLKG